MNKSNKTLERIVGILFLFIFVSGIVVYQVLQGPILFSDKFLTSTSENSNNIIISILLLFLSGLVSVTISAVLFPIFKKHNLTLAVLYLASCIIGFIAISIDNISVLSILELSQEYVKNENSNFMNSFGNVLYKKHWWSHYLSLLISCFPVLVLFYTLYTSKLIPKIISIIGLIAGTLMFIEILSSIFGNSISMNMLIPIGLIQLIFPLWLIIKGLKTDHIS